jgi:2-keto-3-deoxy-galactonokinase
MSREVCSVSSEEMLGLRGAERCWVMDWGTTNVRAYLYDNRGVGYVEGKEKKSPRLAEQSLGLEATG